MLPLITLTIATPAVITTNTTANPTDKADVYLNESGYRKQKARMLLIATLCQQLKPSYAPIPPKQF